jgi:hypothetical protein
MQSSIYDKIMAQLKLRVLKTRIPDTNRYEKELTLSANPFSATPCYRLRQNCLKTVLWTCLPKRSCKLLTSERIGDGKKTDNGSGRGISAGSDGRRRRPSAQGETVQPSVPPSRKEASVKEEKEVVMQSAEAVEPREPAKPVRKKKEAQDYEAVPPTEGGRSPQANLYQHRPLTGCPSPANEQTLI